MKTAIALLVLAGFACRREANPDKIFWDWFEATSPGLAHEPQERAMVKIQDELDSLDIDISGELTYSGSAAGSGDRTLVLTARGRHDFMPVVQRVYDARKAIAGWTIVAFRPRDTSRPLTEIHLHDRALAPSTIQYTAKASAKFAGKLDVDLYVPGYGSADDVLSSMVFIALDHAIGEYDVDAKLGLLDMAPAAQAPATAKPLDQLANDVDNVWAFTPTPGSAAPARASAGSAAPGSPASRD